jgi:NAD(P)-dependent dehydrogenase (short-subunit alcohol dehydrogenase family)
MDRAALVTGGSSGIGAAACRRLCAEGWHVVGLARRPSPDASASLCVDITRFGDLLEAFETIPRLRLVVHAAATIGPVAPLPASDPDDWRRAVEINLLGTYNVLRAALAGPLARGGGLAIHLTSGAASNAKPYWSAYSASKAGAEHLVRSAAVDVEGTMCGVCSLDPGITETAMQRELRTRDFPDRDRFVRGYEQGSGRRPEEVADAIYELSRREPSALNGQTFRVGAL